MAAIVIVSQFLLYLCFAVLWGNLLISLIPAAHRPEIHIPKAVMPAAVFGIALFSLLPVLQIILYVNSGDGILPSIQSVLFTFEIGKAWIFTFLVAIVLFVFICRYEYANKAAYVWIGIALSFMLVLAMAWSSHAASYGEWSGFFIHIVHVIAVSIWAGILFAVSWFSKSYANWAKLLSWYTPMAIVCFLALTVTGLILMSYGADIKEYADGWILPYGQALLIKHLLIIPLLVFAAINGFFIRKRVKKEPGWDPRPWAKAESIIILLIFSATAALSETGSPREMMITKDTASALFTLFYQGNIYSGMTLEWIWNGMSLAFFFVAGLFITMQAVSYRRKLPPASSFFMGVMAVICCYFGLIWGIQ